MGMPGARRCFSWPLSYVQLQRQRQEHVLISSILTERMFRVVGVHHTLLNIIWSNHYCNSISFLTAVRKHTAHDSYYFIIINSDVRFSRSFVANETIRHRHRQTSSRQRTHTVHLTCVVTRRTTLFGRSASNQCQTQSGVRPHFRNVRSFNRSFSVSLFCCPRPQLPLLLACETSSFVVVRRGSCYMIRCRGENKAGNRISCVRVSYGRKNIKLRSYIQSIYTHL